MAFAFAWSISVEVLGERCPVILSDVLCLLEPVPALLILHMRRISHRIQFSGFENLKQKIESLFVSHAFLACNKYRIVVMIVTNLYLWCHRLSLDHFSPNEILKAVVRHALPDPVLAARISLFDKTQCELELDILRSWGCSALSTSDQSFCHTGPETSEMRSIDQCACRVRSNVKSSNMTMCPADRFGLNWFQKPL